MQNAFMKKIPQALIKNVDRKQKSGTSNEDTEGNLRDKEILIYI